MSLDERKQRGADLIERLLGADDADQMRAAWRDVSPELEEYITEFVAGEIWSRPQLDARTKSLVTIATLAGIGRPLALELNIRMARNAGATEREVIETLLHIAPYAGFPAAWEGLVVAKRVFDAQS
jgi:4-carboxymuconolactone decarboxylase